ncbi:hypothetical protein F5879DRAFT_928163, partial [Lentinula edodes]
RFRYFSRKCSRDLAFARHFLEVHGDPGQRTCYSLPTEQWRILYDRVEQSTNSTSALLELNPLDDQDQRELDRQELWEFRQRQPLVPVPSTSVPHTSQLAGSSSLLPPAPVTNSRGRIKTPPVQQRSREPMRPYPHSHASSALRVENDRLKTEVEELRTLLAQSRGQVSTLTSLLRDTSSSLDLRSQELEASRRSLEEVARDRVEYQRVLSQFQAIEAELPEPVSEDLVTRFRIAHSEVDAYKEVANRQQQEIGELRKQVDDVSSRSSDAYAELDSANARALRQRDRLEELEEMVCSYRDRAHVAEGLIRQYPEDE